MSDERFRESDRGLLTVAAVLMLLCSIVSGMVIAGAETVVDGIVMVSVTAIVGLLYGVFAVWSEMRAQGEREIGPRD
jgi:hypothetical protein